MPLRLGVECAVIDDGGRVLLSKRGDLNIWNLPGGRLDWGEALSAAAAREVREETGIIAQVERAVGLYYAAGWQRMNILFSAWPVGGQLLERSFEARANAYFSPNSLPRMWGEHLVRDALASVRPPPRIIETKPGELRALKRRLRWRWIRNLVSGHPEPRFPVFHVQAVGVIWDNSHRRVLTLPGRRSHLLPRVICEGTRAPWRELGELLQKVCHVTPALQWAGVWHDPPLGRFEFVFAATLPEMRLSGDAEWLRLENAALGDRDMLYAGYVRPTFAADPVWVLLHDDEAGQGAVISGGRPRSGLS